MDWQIVEHHSIASLGREMKGWKAAVLDMETIGVEPYLGSTPIGLGLSNYAAEQIYYLPVHNLSPLDLQPILEPLEQLPLIGHDIKFDLHNLYILGWRGQQETFFDTIVLARLWAKEEHPQLGLKEQGKQLFGFEYPNPKVVQMVKIGKADQVPLPELAEYCC